MQKKFNIISLFAGCFVVTVLLLMGCGKQGEIAFKTEPEQELEIQDTEASSDTLLNGEQSSSDQSSTEQGATEQDSYGQSPSDQSSSSQSQKTDALNTTIYVQVNGAVKYPGVYKMQADARVFEAVECAGGMTEEAATEAVNQAEGLTDGQMITIYTTSEWQDLQLSLETADNEKTGQSDSEEKDDRVNINTADKDMLCSIPGVGQVRAESIITYRQDHGEFQSIEDIKNVPGIKDGLFKKIKNKIKV